MGNIFYYIKTIMERQAFGVCEWLGDKLRIRSSRIRMFFVYASFLTIGSPIIIYMVIAFWLDLRKLVYSKRSSFWDL